MAKGWLDNYGKQENYNDSKVSAPKGMIGDGYSNVGRNYSPAWGGQFQMGGSVYPVNYVPQAQMGGSIPGAVGFSYARTQSPAPSNGPYAKKTKASAQDGAKLDMHGNPIIAIEKHDPNLDRSHYDPRLNIMTLGNDYNTWADKDKLLAHENFHAWQFNNDRDNFDIAHHTDQEQWARMQKKPQMMTTDEVWNNYYNRSSKEAESDVNSIMPYIAETSIIPAEVSKDKIFQKIVDNERYYNPYSFEGEAMFYENTGISPMTESRSLASPKFQNGGSKELPSVRSLINDTMNRKIQSKGKGKDVKTVKKDNTKTSTLKEIKKLSGKQQNELAQRLSEEQAAKDYVQANMEEAYKSPLMSPGLFTPEGAAIGALDSAVKVGPNLYEGDYGSAAVNALGALPAVAAFGPELRNIKTSIAPELRQGLHEQGLFDFFKRKPKSNYPKYRIVTDDDLSISNFNKATKDYSKVIDENNIYKDLAKSESARHQNLMKDIEEYGERWKYSDEDIVNSAKKVQDAKKEWDKYAISQEAGIKTNPKFFDDTADNLVFYAGKEGLGKEDLYKFVKGPSGDAWHTASAKPSPYTVYHTNVNDFAKLPNIRTEQEAIRAAQTEAGEVFNEKMSPYKVNLSDIPLNKYGGVIKDDLGQWAHPGEITEINSNDITMEGVPYDVLGISDTGDTKLMKPGKKYKYKGNKVTEFPMAKNGLRQEQKGLVNLDQLTNFTNYNTKQPGGWLDQY
jgi:hypothetical protein